MENLRRGFCQQTVMLAKRLSSCAKVNIMVLVILIPFHISAKEWLIATEHFPPFSYLVHDQVTGFSAEITSLLLDRAGLSYSIVIFPWARAYHIVKTTENSMLFSVARIAEREDEFRWVGPLAVVNIHLWQRPNSPQLNIHIRESLNKLRFGIIRGSAVDIKLSSDPRFTSAAITRLTTINDALELLSMERIDAVLMADNMEPYVEAKLTQLKEKIEKRDLVTVLPLYLALHKTTPPALVSELQQVLDELKREGHYLRLQKDFNIKDTPMSKKDRKRIDELEARYSAREQ